MRHYFNKGWSYAVDYDKEIATDLADIERAKLLIALADTLTAEELGWVAAGYHTSALSLLAVGAADKRGERLALLGITATEAAQAILGYSDEDVYAAAARALDPEAKFVTGPAYGTVQALIKRLDEVSALSVGQAKRQLKGAKASLSRHKRNKEKNGG